MTDHSDGYRCEAGEADRSRCGRGEVDDPPAYERAPIVDANHDRTVRAIVSDTYQGAEGQRAMRRREASTSREAIAANTVSNRLSRTSWTYHPA